MSFKTVFQALHDQLVADVALLVYCNPSQFLKGFKDAIPRQDYTVILEPGNEDEDPGRQSYGKIRETSYNIDIYARTALAGRTIEHVILGDSTTVGVLDFMDDIKSAIRSDLKLGFNRRGYSVSNVNAGTSFALSNSERYISVSMNENTPTGYDEIDCGITTLAGSVVASNIQTALRALGRHTDDGYYDAICIFDGPTKTFTITSSLWGPKSKAVVTAGASNDCSSLLGFDSPTEVVGRNITKIVMGTVTTDNSLYPIRYRVLPLKITEEIKIE